MAKKKKKKLTAPSLQMTNCIINGGSSKELIAAITVLAEAAKENAISIQKIAEAIKTGELTAPLIQVGAIA